MEQAAAQGAHVATVHIVAWGETLTTIAAYYDVTVEAIVAANDLADADHIYAGQQLVIPDVSSIPRTDTSSGAQTHIVQPGENLYRIGLLYNVSVGDLMVANNLQSADQIYVGQALNIPADSTGTHSSPQSVPDSRPDAVGGIHIVQAGETLYSISRQYNVSISSLVAANNLLNPSHIYVGQPLTIPGAATANVPGYTPQEVATTHIVQPGETLASIATRYGVSVWVLAQINNISNPSLIFAGQILTIPSTNALASGEAPITDKAIVVDISEQRVYVYEGGELRWVFVVSTGLPGAETWRGEFQIQNKIPMAYAATWAIQMPYWLGFYWAGPLQNGFHALPILSSGVRLWEGLLGSPASYGCVILGDNDAKLLYEWAEIGTPVRVQD